MCLIVIVIELLCDNASLHLAFLTRQLVRYWFSQKIQRIIISEFSF